MRETAAQQLNNVMRDIDIKTTIYNMVGVLMSDDFYKWMEENWTTIKELEEFDEIMDFYIHGENSCYAR